MKADINKAVVLIDKKQCMDKVHKFIKDNGVSNTKEDLIIKFHKKNPEKNKN